MSKRNPYKDPNEVFWLRLDQSSLKGLIMAIMIFRVCWTRKRYFNWKKSTILKPLCRKCRSKDKCNWRKSNFYKNRVITEKELQPIIDMFVGFIMLVFDWLFELMWQICVGRNLINCKSKKALFNTDLQIKSFIIKL